MPKALQKLQKKAGGYGVGISNSKIKKWLVFSQQFQVTLVLLCGC